MNTADYVIMAALLLSAILGAARGLLREVIAFVTWIAAVIVAWHFSDVIEPHLGGLLAGASVKPWVARLVILFLVLLLGALIGAMVSQFVRLSIFSGVDRLGGFAFGGLRGLLFLGLFVIFGQLVHLDREHWWRDSHLIPTGESVANALRFLVGEGGLPHSRDTQV
ncbi:MAG TPA: CvpA family protein [Steroidobacteraceae bacterium]|nr:CvpA family protein [Steroidobacteraceae bacterium]